MNEWHTVNNIAALAKVKPHVVRYHWLQARSELGLPPTPCGWLPGDLAQRLVEYIKQRAYPRAK